MLVGKIVQSNAAIGQNTFYAKRANLALLTGHYFRAKGYKHFGAGPHANLFCGFW